MKMHQISLLLLNLAVALAGTIAAHAAPVSTSFTYQGQLKSNGVPVNSPQDFRFTLFPASTGASPIGNPSVNEFLCHPVVNGMFTLGLNFGDVTAYNGQARWLEIAARPCGDTVYQVMPQRVELLPTPYAIQSLSARQVEPNGVDASALKNGAVTGEKILDGSIGATKVNSSTFGATFWKVDGNAGTTAGANFLGTADNQPLEFKVDGVRALRLQPHATEPSSLIGGYSQNSLGGAGGAVIAGGGTSGSINETLGNYAFVGAGHGSKAGGFSAVVGGAYNVSPSLYSFIGSGLGNTNLGGAAVIAGGVYNRVSALGENAFIGGGVQNTANNIYATIGGGEQNVSSMFATVGGGRGNQGGGSYSTVAGGRENRTAATYASSGGGYFNLSGGQYATVAGGTRNVSDSTGSTVGGGSNNVIQVSSDASVIAGGQNNSIHANSVASTIAGGEWNTNEATHTTIGGGMGNRTGGPGATVGGGLQNTSSGAGATVGGGLANSSSSDGATVPGGLFNTAAGRLSFAAGNRAKANHRGSFVWADSQDSDFTSTAEDQFSVRALGGIHFETTGATINGRPLLTSADLGNLWQLGGNSIAPGQFLGTANAEPLELKVNGQRALRLEATLGAPNVIGGAEGNYVAPGVIGATIGGGGSSETNKVTGSDGTIGGGAGNTSFLYGTVAGGSANTAGYYATVGGGSENTAMDLGDTVGGGGANTSSGQYATVGGGWMNTASGGSGTVGGGANNSASGIVATVPGGSGNIASGDASLAGGSHSAASGFISTALGEGNLASGRASVAIGSFTSATAEFTMAAGRKAKASHPGSFVWADSTDADFDSTANDQFSIRASGGVRLLGAGLFSMGTENGVVGSSAHFLGNGSGVYGVHSAQGRGVTGKATGIGTAIYGDNPNPSGWAGDFDGNVRVRLSQSFGAQTRQMLNLWNQAYGIGVQPSTLYFRADNGTAADGFAWFRGGFHVDAIKDPGPGGELLMKLDTAGLTVRGTFVSSSDRNVKAGFEAVDTKSILEKVAALPLTRWHYTNDTASPHLGPVAQDFHAAFGLGSDDKHIATVDADGVALAAIQGLNQKLEEKEKEITELKQSLEELKGLVSKLAGQQNRGAQ